MTIYTLNMPYELSAVLRQGWDSCTGPNGWCTPAPSTDMPAGLCVPPADLVHQVSAALSVSNSFKRFQTTVPESWCFEKQF